MRVFTGLMLLPLLLAAACGERAPEGAIAIRAARIYPAPDAPPVDDGAVVWTGTTIFAAGPAGEIATRGAGSYPHCDGGIVVAGYQNSHVHFTGTQFQSAATRPASELTAALTTMLTRHGFTTVVDTASDIANTAALRARMERGEIEGPRILTTGFGIYPRDGIPVYLRDLPLEVQAALPQPATVQEALAVVQSNFERGADATKLFVMTPQGKAPPKFMNPEIAIAAADETHRRGALVLAHPTDVEGIALALEAGVDVLVHTTIGGGKTVWEPALVEQMVAADVAVVPTLKLWSWELRRARLPERIVEAATGDAIEQLRTFHAAGGQVLFGTDVGYMTDDDPTEEYRLMARALTPMQILESLTTAPAARWQEGAERGRVAAGQAADLVVLDADPAEDAANFAKVRCTIRGGRLLYDATAGP